jgi:hypothetical protein
MPPVRLLLDSSIGPDDRPTEAGSLINLMNAPALLSPSREGCLAAWEQQLENRALFRTGQIPFFPRPERIL